MRICNFKTMEDKETKNIWNLNGKDFHYCFFLSFACRWQIIFSKTKNKQMDRRTDGHISNSHSICIGLKIYFSLFFENWFFGYLPYVMRDISGSCGRWSKVEIDNSCDLTCIKETRSVRQTDGQNVDRDVGFTCLLSNHYFGRAKCSKLVRS